MHEMSVAESLVETITKEAKKANAKPTCATISCGQLNPINEEVMKFAFEVVTRDTICEGMDIKVVQVSWQAKCKDCAEPFDFDVYSPKCPKCEGTKFELEEDAPLLLDEIEFDENIPVNE